MTRLTAPGNFAKATAAGWFLQLRALHVAMPISSEDVAALEQSPVLEHLEELGFSESYDFYPCLVAPLPRLRRLAVPLGRDPVRIPMLLRHAPRLEALELDSRTLFGRSPYARDPRLEAVIAAVPASVKQLAFLHTVMTPEAVDALLERPRHVSLSLSFCQLAARDVERLRGHFAGGFTCDRPVPLPVVERARGWFRR
jgi:hypothetical protein